MSHPHHPQSDLRTRIERRSQVALVYLAGLPRLVVPVVMVAVAAGGLLAPPLLGGALLLILVAFLGWLGYLSWPRVEGPARVLRLLAVGVILGAAVVRLTA